MTVITVGQLPSLRRSALARSPYSDFYYSADFRFATVISYYRERVAVLVAHRAGMAVLFHELRALPLPLYDKHHGVAAKVRRQLRARFSAY